MSGSEWPAFEQLADVPGFTVPVHRATVFYYFGGMALFFFMIQVVTGILLMLEALDPQTSRWRVRQPRYVRLGLS